jgi:adenine-specific DNA-methyltransferase
MTNILDGLLARIQDQGLRAALTSEVERLRDTKDFGLVFERHIPENVRLYSYPVKRGVTVQDRSGTSDATWLVRRVKDGKADLLDPDGEELARPLEDLVVVRQFGEPIYPGLTRVGAIEQGGDKPFHTVINGENYHVLETLLYAYAGKVDCVYIDPPYNSGARDWKYNNDYVDTEDAYRHSKWLAFMERRLRLAKQLLNPADSVLIVAIDEKEYLRLGLLLQEMFSGCTIQMVTSVVNPQGTGRTNEFSRTNEFLFFVMIGGATIFAGPDNMYDRDGTGVPTRVEWRNLRRRERTSKRGSRPNQFYAVFVDEKTGRIHSVGEPLPNSVARTDVKVPKGTRACFPLTPNGTEMIWGVVPDSLRALVEKGYARSNGSTIQFLNAGTVKAIDAGDVMVSGRDSQGAVIAEFAEGTKRLMPKTVWVRDSHNAQASGTLMLNKLIPGREFPFPKSLYAVEDALRFFVREKPGAVVLDFFGGSGTTAHAVARLNRQDEGRRQSIIITNNEVSEAEAKALRVQGHVPGDDEWETLGIFQHVTLPRITAAITGMTPDGSPIVGDYKFPDESAMADGFEENVEFLELSYLDRNEVSRGKAFEAIAPLLWLKAGATGSMIAKVKRPFAAPSGARYCVLFDINHWHDFAEAIRERDDLTHIFVITDSVAQYQQVVAELPPTADVSMLYEDYLRNFEINVGGAQ